jgi:hypothetical protein
MSIRLATFWQLLHVFLRRFDLVCVVANFCDALLDGYEVDFIRIVFNRDDFRLVVEFRKLNSFDVIQFPLDALLAVATLRIGLNFTRHHFLSETYCAHQYEE